MIIKVLGCVSECRRVRENEAKSKDAGNIWATFPTQNPALESSIVGAGAGGGASSIFLGGAWSLHRVRPGRRGGPEPQGVEAFPAGAGDNHYEQTPDGKSLHRGNAGHPEHVMPNAFPVIAVVGMVH